MKLLFAYTLLFSFLVGIGFASEYDATLFKFDEVNKLRRLPPHKRMDLFRKILDRRTRRIGMAVQMRNYERSMELNRQLDRVLEYVLEDIRVCLEEPKMKDKRQLRKCEVSFRKNITTLKGARRAVPFAHREHFDPVIQKLSYCRKLLFNFINGLNG